MAGEDHLRELEARYEDFKVYDNAGEKIGKVDDLFIDEADREEYIGVKMGFFGLSSTLIPMEIVRVDERERIMEVSESKGHVRDAPTFDDDDDITPEFEDRIRRHFGLESMEASAGRGSYGRFGGATASGTTAGAATTAGDVGSGGRESYRDREDVGPSESPMESARAEDETRSGGPRDLETGERDRVGDEGFREGGRRGERGDRDDLEPSGTVTGAGRAEEGITRRETGEPEGGGRMDDEGYREGFREGFREGLRAGSEGGGRGESGDREEPGGRGEFRDREGFGGRGEFGDREDQGSSGTVRGAGPAEEGMTRREVGEPGDRDRIRDEGFREGGSGDRDTGADRPGDEARRSEGEGEREEGGIARVWRRIRS